MPTLCACVQRTLQSKLETSYLSGQEKNRQHEAKLDSANARTAQVHKPNHYTLFGAFPSPSQSILHVEIFRIALLCMYDTIAIHLPNSVTFALKCVLVELVYRAYSVVPLCRIVYRAYSVVPLCTAPILWSHCVQSL